MSEAPSSAHGTYPERLAAATQEWHDRRAHRSRPQGQYTRGAGGWYPAASERRECCTPRLGTSVIGFRSHLRGVEHIAHLYDVQPTDLAAALKTK